MTSKLTTGRILAHLHDHGPSTLRQITDTLGNVTTADTRDHLRDLEERGLAGKAYTADPDHGTILLWQDTNPDTPAQPDDTTRTTTPTEPPPDELFKPQGRSKVECTVCGSSGYPDGPWQDACRSGHPHVCEGCGARKATGQGLGAHRRHCPALKTGVTIEAPDGPRIPSDSFGHGLVQLDPDDHLHAAWLARELIRADARDPSLLEAATFDAYRAMAGRALVAMAGQQTIDPANVDAGPAGGGRLVVGPPLSDREVEFTADYGIRIFHTDLVYHLPPEGGVHIDPASGPCRQEPAVRELGDFLEDHDMSVEVVGWLRAHPETARHILGRGGPLRRDELAYLLDQQQPEAYRHTSSSDQEES